MRLLFVSHSFPPDDAPLESIGGMQRVAVELAGELSKRNDLYYQQLILQSSWKWHHLQCAPWMAATAMRLYRIARKQSVDVVLFSSMVTGAISTLIRKKCTEANIKLAAIAHGRDVTLPGVYQTLQVGRTLKALDCVLPVSTATGDECVKRGIPTSRVQVTPNGVAMSRYSFGQGSQGDRLELLSVGRLVKRKGFAWFVDQVMPLLPSNVHYRIAGSGPESDAIQKAIKQQGLEGRVHLMGRCSDQTLARLYEESDLLIMPNVPVDGDMEGFGVVMLEAGASGTPVVAADIEGIRDVITDGANGKLVPSGDPERFKKAILNTPLSQSIRTNVHAHTATQFSWPKIADLYVNHLKNLHTGAIAD